MLFKPNRLLIVLLVFVLLFTVSAVRVAHAQDEVPDDGGAIVAGDEISPEIPTAITIGAGISWLLAFFPYLSEKFRALPNGTKRVILFLLSIGVGVVLLLSKNQPGTLQNLSWEQIIFFVQNVLAALAATQVEHAVVNKPLLKKDGLG